jgi:hypothetical protein
MASNGEKNAFLSSATQACLFMSMNVFAFLRSIASLEAASVIPPNPPGTVAYQQSENQRAE